MDMPALGKKKKDKLKWQNTFEWELIKIKIKAVDL